MGGALGRSGFGWAGCGGVGWPAPGREQCIPCCLPRGLSMHDILPGCLLHFLEVKLKPERPEPTQPRTVRTHPPQEKHRQLAEAQAQVTAQEQQVAAKGQELSALQVQLEEQRAAVAAAQQQVAAGRALLEQEREQQAAAVEAAVSEATAKARERLDAVVGSVARDAASVVAGWRRCFKAQAKCDERAQEQAAAQAGLDAEQRRLALSWEELYRWQEAMAEQRGDEMEWRAPIILPLVSRVRRVSVAWGRAMARGVWCFEWVT